MTKSSILSWAIGPLLFLIGSSFTYGAAPEATLELTRSQKQEWITELDQCSDRCEVLARELLDTYAQNYPDAFISLRNDASVTLVYLHSYSLYPRHDHDAVNFLNWESQQKLNIVAPVFTAHQHDASPTDFLNVQPEDWMTDAELAVKLGHALGKPVVLAGFSLGGLLAAYADVEFPQYIEKLVLAAPALMIKHYADPLACAAKDPVIQGIIETIEDRDDQYMQKYLNGVCSLSKTMNKFRTLFGTSPEEGIDSYQRALDNIQAWAHLIPSPTFAIYSEHDEALEIPALKTLSDNVQPVISVVFPNSMGVAHLQTLTNRPLNGPDRDVYSALDRFIRE